MQLLATRGYAVLLPDSPQGVGTPMLDLAKTILPGVNKVIEMGVADPDRLSVMGQSNGGYSALGLLVQTQRFKAAIALDGMGNLVSHYAELDNAGTTYGVALEHGQNALGGSPWEVRDRYIENSPFFYLDRIETPLLIVHGAEDTTVASYESDEVFVGLRRLGKEVEYAKYKGEAHTQLGWSYANQVDVCTRMLGWLEDHLKRGD
jgi:dipeptidyl aminopeptidase/acylaminoacyl peptidase